MREQHPFLDAAVDADAPVWRYFDFPKFVSLLEKRALYFSRADLLGDPLEGSFTKAYAAELRALLTSPSQEVTAEEIQDILRHNAAFFATQSEDIYVNCWHLGDHESMAMWQGYGGGPYGVAIKSTYGVLDAVLPSTFGDPQAPVFLGRVRYLDYSSPSERIPKEYNVFSRFTCKHIAYQHEKEIRAIFMCPNLRFGTCAVLGHSVTVDLETLIRRVMVSPLSPPWFDELVKSVCVRLECDAEVGRSDVLGPPVY